MTTKLRSIRSKDDPKKPCNVAYADGRDARRHGEARERCPFPGGDAYEDYLRLHWLRGYDELKISQAVATSGFIRRRFEGEPIVELQCGLCGAKVTIGEENDPAEPEALHRAICGARRKKEERDDDR